MKVKAHLRLRHIGRRHIIVDTDNEQTDLTTVYTLNDTAADIWTMAATMDTIDLDAIVCHIVDTYEVDREKAATDVRGMLNQWLEAGLLTE